MPARKPYNIPKIWPGSTVFVLGGGPSLGLCDISLLKGRRVIAVNQAFRLAPWAPVLYFGDCGFFQKNLEAINKFAGLKLTSCQAIPPKGEGWPYIHRLRRRKPHGIYNAKRNAVSWNGNSGASAINVAHHLGATKIVLLGFDMQKIEGRNNYHDYYEEKPETWNPYKRHMLGWPTIAADAKRFGIEIVNTTKGSRIAEFPIVPLEELL